LNLNGAVDTQTMQVVVRADETLDAASTIGLFEALEKKHLTAGRIYVIADNARYYRSRLVRKYLRKSRIKLVFLPVLVQPEMDKDLLRIRDKTCLRQGVF
jgi:transposase